MDIETYFDPITKFQNNIFYEKNNFLIYIIQTKITLILTDI